MFQHTPPRRLTAALASIAMAVSALASLLGPAIPASAAPVPSVSIVMNRAQEPPDGVLDVAVNVAVPAASTRLTVRLRLFSRTGTVLYQDVANVSDVEPQSYALGFTHQLSGLRLEEGRYPIEVTASLKGGGTAIAKDAILVVDEDREPVPLVVIAHVTAPPSIAPDGRFLVDPALGSIARAEAESLARLAVVRPDVALSVSVAPVLVEEWARAARGYETSGVAPVAVGREDTGAVVCATTIESLARAAETSETAPLLPYAEPDVGLLSSMDALGDLGSHFDAGALALRKALGSATPSGVLLPGGTLPAEAVADLSGRGFSYAVVATSSVEPAKPAVTSGTYRAAESTLTLLVTDAQVSAMLADPAVPLSALLDRLFERMADVRRGGRAIVAVVAIGPGSAATSAALAERLDAISRTGWVRLVSPGAAAAMRSNGQLRALPAVARAGDAYSSSLALARTRAAALAEAAGARDADAIAALHDVLVAESAAWAGTEPGRAAVSDAARRADAVFAAVTMAVPDVTLSGTAGNLPLNVTNTSDRQLRVVLRARSSSLRTPRDKRTVLVLRKGENILSVPVDLGQELSGSLSLKISAGEVSLAAADVRVRGSYIDRLALAGSVVSVLLVLLWYIRRKSRSGRGVAPGSGAAARGATAVEPGEEAGSDG